MLGMEESWKVGKPGSWKVTSRKLEIGKVRSRQLESVCRFSSCPRKSVFCRYLPVKIGKCRRMGGGTIYTYIYIYTYVCVCILGHAGFLPSTASAVRSGCFCGSTEARTDSDTSKTDWNLSGHQCTHLGVRLPSAMGTGASS